MEKLQNRKHNFQRSRKEQNPYDSDGDAMDDKERHATMLEQAAAFKQPTYDGEVRTRLSKIDKNDEFASLEDGMKVRTYELVRNLSDSQVGHKFRKQLRRAHKVTETLPVPLSEAEQLRAVRSVTYDNTSKQMSKWDDVVDKNRDADQLRFPLGPGLQPDSTRTVSSRFQYRSEMEIEIDRLLQQGSYDEKLKLASIEKIKDERKEKKRRVDQLHSFYDNLAKRRYLRIQIANTLRQRARANKIKAKGYHRYHLKRERKQQERELTALRDSDPAAYADRLEELDRLRMKERMSLKHKFRSRRLRKQMVFSKHGGDMQQLVNEMIEKNKQLTQKRVEHKADSDEEAEHEEFRAALVGADAAQRKVTEAVNPWISAQLKNVVVQHSVVPDTTVTQKVGSAKKNSSASAPDTEKTRSVKKNTDASVPDAAVDDDDSDEDMEENELQLSTTRRQTLEDFDGDWHLSEKYATGTDALSATGSDADSKQHTSKMQPTKAKKEQPERVRVVHSSLKTDVDVTMLANDDDDDDIDAKQQRRMTLAQAFASDDVIAEFDATKRAQIAEEQPEDVCTALPGWGQWGGEGLAISKRSRRKKTLKAPKIQRRDADYKRVIIAENPDAKLAPHQLSTIPRAFVNAETYQAYIRQPIGKMWNPETTFHKLTQPKVVTKAGQTIEPIAEDAALKPVKRVLEVKEPKVRPFIQKTKKLRAEKKALRDAIKRKRLQDVADTASAEVDTEKQKLTEADSNDEQNPWGEDSDDEGKAATDDATGKRLTKKEKRALKWQRRDTKEWSVQQHAKLVQQALAVKHSVDGNKPLVPIEACFVNKWLKRKEEKNTVMTEAQRKRALRKEIYGKRNQSERGKKKRGASSQSQSHGESAAKDTPRNYVTKKH